MKQYDEAELDRLAEELGEKSALWASYADHYKARCLANGMEKLAKDANQIRAIQHRIAGGKKNPPPSAHMAQALESEAASLRAWADEQDKPKEPTMVEKPKDCTACRNTGNWARNMPYCGHCGRKSDWSMDGQYRSGTLADGWYWARSASGLWSIYGAADLNHQKNKRVLADITPALPPAERKE